MQGQFGSQKDVDFAINEGRYMNIGERKLVEAPSDTKNILHLPTGGTIKSTHVFIEIKPAGKTGTIHGFPAPKNYKITPRSTKIRR